MRNKAVIATILVILGILCYVDLQRAQEQLAAKQKVIHDPEGLVGKSFPLKIKPGVSWEKDRTLTPSPMVLDEIERDRRQAEKDRKVDLALKNLLAWIDLKMLEEKSRTQIGQMKPSHDGSKGAFTLIAPENIGGASLRAWYDEKGRWHVQSRGNSGAILDVRAHQEWEEPGWSPPDLEVNP